MTVLSSNDATRSSKGNSFDWNKFIEDLAKYLVLPIILCIFLYEAYKLWVVHRENMADHNEVMAQSELEMADKVSLQLDKELIQREKERKTTMWANCVNWMFKAIGYLGLT
ncbi:hypothetical protein [Roseivirga thermotolerans]|uniref:hypothetical protein n=1 Tax=Roseivirga thermotolerans TaxID=1758176 RepID=UPI00273FC9C0|nr:hypothetical protein [Roseivirga thermotolerans]